MKKALGIVMASALVFSLAGCSAKASNTTSNQSGSTASNTTATYKDGTYDIKNKSKKPGYEEAVVTIKDGKIQNIDLKRLDDKSSEVNYDDWDGTKNGMPNLKKFRQDLANAMIEKQSTKVDSISGATISSEGWKQAVTDALKKASK